MARTTKTPWYKPPVTPPPPEDDKPDLESVWGGLRKPFKPLLGISDWKIPDWLKYSIDFGGEKDTGKREGLGPTDFSGKPSSTWYSPMGETPPLSVANALARITQLKNRLQLLIDTGGSEEDVAKLEELLLIYMNDFQEAQERERREFARSLYDTKTGAPVADYSTRMQEYDAHQLEASIAVFGEEGVKALQGEEGVTPEVEDNIWAEYEGNVPPEILYICIHSTRNKSMLLYFLMISDYQALV